jgi:thioredoxin-dependent peroxiredoxin
MSLRIGDVAPNFDAQTTAGPINFHDWLGDGWGVLFSHPKDFTPVCTTELGYMAKIKPEFDKRNVKIIGISVDSVDRHSKWADDIKETQGYAPNYPMIGDLSSRSQNSTACSRWKAAVPAKGVPQPTTRPCATCS